MLNLTRNYISAKYGLRRVYKALSNIFEVYKAILAVESLNDRVGNSIFLQIIYIYSTNHFV